MIRQPRAFVGLLTSVCAMAFVSASAVHAQTRPGNPPNNPRTPGGQGTGGRSQLPVASGSLTLPAWLDDAETLDAGTASFELSVGRWSAIDGGETDGPIVEAAVGVTGRLQLGATVPYYRASYTQGFGRFTRRFSTSGLGDTYLSAKIQLFDPADYSVGVSVQPLVEILSQASVSDPTLGVSRVNFALPVTFQVGSNETRTRAYATAGLFTRHAVFAGAAVEQDVGHSVTLIGMLSYTYATSVSAASDLAGLNRSRTDASGMIYVGVTKLVTVFAGGGRTISQLDQNGARLIASAGIRIETTRPGAKP